MIKIVYISLIITVLMASCKKDPARAGNEPGPVVTNSRLSYGDSVFHIRSTTYEISPLNARAGTYTAFPSNLLIDPATGKITVSIIGKGEESQTGMKYKIVFQPSGSGEKDSTYITLSGINYLDRIYYLSQDDSIISPIYNGELSRAVPGGSYGIQADNDLAIDPSTGRINIKECIRRGLFNRPAENGEWEELTVQYKLNDQSNSATNKLDIALYYYNSINDVPSNVSSVMRAHQTMMLGVAQPEIPQTTGPIDNDLPDNLSFSRPRPPCVIIIAN